MIPSANQPAAGSKHRSHPVFSLVTDQGTLVETVYDRPARSTRFAIWQNGGLTYDRSIQGDSRRFVPFGGQNSLLEHGVILLPSQAVE